MVEALYYVSLSIVIIAAIVIALHSAIPGGFVGATCLGGVAVFGIAGFDSSPPNWLVGFTVSLAGAAVWAGARWQFCRFRLRRKLRL